MRIKLGEDGEDGIYFLYKVYKKEIDNPVAFEKYRQVVFAFNKAIAIEILEKGSNIKLPGRMGCLRVKKTKMNYQRLFFDYGEFNKSGLKTYHTNVHSDDFKVKILWEKMNCIVKNKAPWSFTASRANKRTLARLMKENGGHKRYTEELSYSQQGKTKRKASDNKISTD